MKSIIISLLLLIMHQCLAAQSVGIGTNSPNTSAQLDITSTTKGILIPRMTDAEKNAILSPVQGLMIFNTNSNSFQYYTGASWSNLTHSGIVSGTPGKVPKFNGLWGLGPGMLLDNGKGIAVNSTNTVADSSALLDMASNNKGILIPRMSSVDRAAITTPATGLLVFDNTTNSFWFYNSSAWQELNTGGASSNWTDSANNINNTNTGNVGIGTAAPAHKLHVAGRIKANSDIITDGYVGVGTPTPVYKLHVTDGSLAISNTTDNKTWTINYNSASNGLNISETGTSRMLIENGGNAGIGTTNPAYKLDVAGTVRATGNIVADGNGIIEGSLSVNNGKGVAYNANSGTNLKIYTFTTGTFYAVLGPHERSAEGTFGFGGGFTSTPKMFVGDIYSTGGTVGQLYMVSLEVYGCDNNSCKVRLVNHSDGPVNYEIRWNMMAVGF